MPARDCQAVLSAVVEVCTRSILPVAFAMPRMRCSPLQQHHGETQPAARRSANSLAASTPLHSRSENQCNRRCLTILPVCRMWQ